MEEFENPKTSSPQVLVVDDEPAVCETIARSLREHRIECAIAQSFEDGLARLKSAPPAVAVLDIGLPGGNGMSLLRTAKALNLGVEFIMITGQGSIDMAVEAMKLGALDFLVKPFSPEVLVLQIQRAANFSRLSQENQRLRRAALGASVEPVFIASDKRMKEVLDLIDQVAPYNTNVLIAGETGTGKDVVARLFHAKSPRRDEPFIPLNCTAVQDTLFESELFGHEKGAFTGAVESRPGLLEAASEGTFFLDEVGDLPSAVQGKLLRAIELGEFRRVGSVQTRHSQARIIAATSRELEKACREGKFRQDLLFRLNEVTLFIPPLRERPCDIPLLAEHFLRMSNERFGKEARSLSQEALKALCAQSWPGNVRELKHAIDRAVLTAKSPVLTAVDLNLGAPTTGAAGQEPPANISLAELERQHILGTLKAQQGQREKTALILGISTRTLSRKLAEYGMA